jgi:methylated-DNA-[protein]-cysteine S-methyltransferase
MALSLFPTALGTCGLSWNDTGLTGFQLPEKNSEVTERKLAARAHNAATDTPRPLWVRRLIVAVQQHLEGQLQDFAAIPLDWSQVSDFQRAVYQQTRAIKPGDSKSYGELAQLVGLGVKAARAIGVAMAKNPWPLIVPCHRVVSAKGKMTGYSAAGGIRTKTRLLVLEGAELLSE